MLVKQQVAKTAQDIFMGIRFVGSSSQRTHDGLWHAIKRLYNDVWGGDNLLGGYEEGDPHVNSYESSLHFWALNKQRAA